MASWSPSSLSRPKLLAVGGVGVCDELDLGGPSGPGIIKLNLQEENMKGWFRCQTRAIPELLGKSREVRSVLAFMPLDFGVTQQSRDGLVI